MAKYGLWFLIYGTCTTTLFLLSLASLASKAFDYFSLIHELTHSYHLTLLLNFVAFFFLLWGILSTRFLFGTLRIIETEHMVEQLPFFAFNLLFILFTDDNVLLGMLWGATTVLIKVYHIITLDRLDLLQLTTGNNLSEIHTPGRIFRAFACSKFVWYISLFVFLDMFMAKLLVFDVFQGMSSVCSLLYGMQFAVMAIDNLAYVWKLSLNLYELMYYRCPSPSSSTQTPAPSASPLASESVQVAAVTENDEGLDEEAQAPILADVPDENMTIAEESEDDIDFSDDEDDETERVWEMKPVYSQSLEILTSVIKSAFYLAFSYMLYAHSDLTPPLPMLQGGIVCMLQVVNKSRTFVAFLSNAKSLEKQLVDASAEDLDGSDHMCIICRDNMHLPDIYQARRHKPLSPRKHPKKLACGHILHMGCLKDWLERSTVCPLCRKPVFPAPVAPVPELNPEHIAHETEFFHPPPEVEETPGLMEREETRLIFQQLIESTDRVRRGINAPPQTAAQNRYNEPTPVSESVTEVEIDETVPSGWEVLPLTGAGPDQFSIRLSSTHSGTLTVSENRKDVGFYTLERV